jgi:capsid portal protein
MVGDHYSAGTLCISQFIKAKNYKEKMKALEGAEKHYKNFVEVLNLTTLKFVEIGLPKTLSRPNGSNFNNNEQN